MIGRMYAELDGTGRIEATVDLRDVMAWEDDRDRPFSTTNRIGDVSWLVWHAAHRTGATTLTWEGWRAVCVEAGNATDIEAGPTRPAPPDGS